MSSHPDDDRIDRAPNDTIDGDLDDDPTFMATDELQEAIRAARTAGGDAAAGDVVAPGPADPADTVDDDPTFMASDELQDAIRNARAAGAENSVDPEPPGAADPDAPTSVASDELQAAIRDAQRLPSDVATPSPPPPPPPPPPPSSPPLPIEGAGDSADATIEPAGSSLRWTPPARLSGATVVREDAAVIESSDEDRRPVTVALAVAALLAIVVVALLVRDGAEAPAPPSTIEDIADDSLPAEDG